ncbi:outer membrane lipid asymmetry maintenance protein MlaD [Woodsholea maritima]|uniref:outer membrane lipid asymmetry maintenance protein MlaD n=1 Tax=Woodsholea maritima TaxID=240237 RepID=UPI00035E9438|nr:outer membrane lipid asymmetry maintenance protein MlaD [Woodsholea maritima]
MRASALVETLIGAGVLAAAGFFLFYAGSNLSTGQSADGYTLSARFSTIGGLTRGADVRVAGVPVGTVSAIELDQQTYLARAVMRLDGGIEIPEDSSARIASNGLLGGAFVEIEPGGLEEALIEGGEIQYTQGAVDIFSLIGEAVMNRASGGSEDGSSAQDDSARSTTDAE